MSLSSGNLNEYDRYTTNKHIFLGINKKDGTIESKVAPVLKSIHSLYKLISPFRSIVTRYLEFNSSNVPESDIIPFSTKNILSTFWRISILCVTTIIMS